MASTIAFVAPFLILLLASPTVFGTDYTVGDSSGWTLGGNYATWASGKTFKVGDTLLFNYDSTHQVDQVDANGYQSCSTSNVIKNYNDGKTKITLDKAGKWYFICPTPGHCSGGGMKLEVNVVAATTPATPSGSPPKASPTTPSGTTPATTPTAPSGSPTTPEGSTPSAPSPSGAVSINGLVGSVIGFVLALGLMF